MKTRRTLADVDDLRLHHSCTEVGADVRVNRTSGEGRKGDVSPRHEYIVVRVDDDDILEVSRAHSRS